MIRKLYDSKPIYSNINTLYLIFLSDRENLGKRNQFYDVREGYIYHWQMKLVNLIKNRKDKWTIEDEYRY